MELKVNHEYISCVGRIMENVCEISRIMSEELVRSQCIQSADPREALEYLRTIHYGAVMIQKMCRPYIEQRAGVEHQIMIGSHSDKSEGPSSAQESHS